MFTEIPLEKIKKAIILTNETLANGRNGNEKAYNKDGRYALLLNKISSVSPAVRAQRQAHGRHPGALL